MKADIPLGASPWPEQQPPGHMFRFWVCLFLLLPFPFQMYTAKAEDSLFGVETGNGTVFPSN